MKRILLIALVLILLVGVGLFLKNKILPTYKGITGIIDLNGVAPADSSIILSQRIANSTDAFVTFAQDIPAQDGTLWQFINAEKGKSYEIQAAVVYKNNVLTESSPIFVTAPAINEPLTLNVSSEHLIAAAIPTPIPAQAVIAGTVGVNGYIPSGATITIEGRSLGKTNYTVVASDLSAVDNQVMTYTSAVAGQTYEVRGFLYDSMSNQIGQSNVITITAPAQNETLSINSSAQPPVTPTPTAQATQPPVTTTAISGSINFNGQAPSNSRIVIFQRLSGTPNYQVAIDNISPVDGTTWSWNNAMSGTSYDLLAILKQKQSNGTDKDISDSNGLTLSAPAAHEVFSINSGFALPQASGSITASCNNYDSGSQTWQVAVSYQSIQGAEAYWFQIGITNGGIELTNSTANATNNTSQTYQYTFKNNVTYYARYAYANTQNLFANSSQFSPLSSTQQLRCSQ